MAQNKNMFITIALAIVIVTAIGVFVFTNLESTNQNNDDPSDANTNDETKEDEETLLTIVHKDNNYSYTLSDLENVESYTKPGRKIKSNGVIIGPYNYTGVKITTLMDEIGILAEPYEITITASDGYNKTFTKNQTQGILDFYNEDGNITENGSATMIVAYQEDGVYYDEEYPLRIAFIGEYMPITSSSLWIKMITTIEIDYLS